MFDSDELRALATDSQYHTVQVPARELLELLAEYGRLREAMERAPLAIMDTRDDLGICAPTEDDFPALYALQGHRVALIDMGPNVQGKPRAACGDSA